MAPPPVPPRTRTQIEQDLEAFSINLRQVSEELAAERKARQEEREKGISILRLHVPLVAVLAIVGALVGTGVAGGIFITRTAAHTANTKIHVDGNRDVAYKDEVSSDIADVQSAIEASNRRALRVLVRSSPLKCTATPGRKSSKCEFDEAEPPR